MRAQPKSCHHPRLQLSLGRKPGVAWGRHCSNCPQGVRLGQAWPEQGEEASLEVMGPLCLPFLPTPGPATSQRPQRALSVLTSCKQEAAWL